MNMLTSAASMAALAIHAANPPRSIAAQPRADITGDTKSMLDQIKAAVEEMRKLNDTRLDKIEAKIDPLDVDQFGKISDAISAMEKTMDEHAKIIAAGKLNGNGAVIGDLEPTDPEYVSAFKLHMRRGTEISASLNKATDSEGGYLAPIEWDRTISGKLKRVSAVRQNSRVISISTAGFKKLFTDRAVGSGWVGETAARPQTSTPAFASLDFIPGELYANPAATQQMLDDAALDLEQWLADEINTEFARQEGIAFLSGDGTNKPYGILTYVTGAANAARHPWGAISVVNSGAAAALTADGIINLMYDLPSEFAGNAKLYLNRLSLREIRKLKDGQGNFLWQPSFVAGEPATINAAPVVELPDMPTIAAGNIAALYGDMEATYLIIDRVGTRVLRDPFTNKPFVHFYTTKRVGGGVVNPESMRALKVSA
ncbi:phage capsid protein [Sphingobium jiangsuense]|uniref:HK97 family phage major capsid protein n=1 Tax=Sphingobium jiangsuense TaxID=870476 RepID=A0A7W6FPH8_9SPHN|nr:phage major capsid protein [Sphingobium jiangsuense]MBB3925049.1 HK97 family phage major capsid protein [Sphingobium jiangsuense]GLT00122.1 phage capsid protein [Sphingobium jiangsuense]